MNAGDARLLEVGNQIFAYEQPDGGWGLSNAGLIASGDKSLLVDTLFDRARTQRMLDAMAGASRASIDVVVNTHDNGDHCYGNELVAGRRIVASAATAREMQKLPAKKVAMLLALARALSSEDAQGVKARILGGAQRMLTALGLGAAADFFAAAPFVVASLGRFTFEGIRTTLPTETFTGNLSLDVGGRRIELLEIGPAHTPGDVAVWVPDARVLFTGDLVFSCTHPLVWAGTPSACAAACDRLSALGPSAVVPGHGPLADAQGLSTQASYYRALLDEARPLHAAGVPIEEAALRLATAGFGPVRERPRLAVNVRAAYRELGGAAAAPPLSPIREFAAMARLASALAQPASPRS